MKTETHVPSETELRDWSVNIFCFQLFYAYNEATFMTRAYDLLEKDHRWYIYKHNCTLACFIRVAYAHQMLPENAAIRKRVIFSRQLLKTSFPSWVVLILKTEYFWR